MLSVVACVVAVFGALPCAGADDPSPFGIVCPWPEVGQTGARWVRCGAGATQLVDWGKVEPEQDRFEWDAADSELEKWDKPEGLTPLPILAYTAPWASSGPKGEREYPPGDLNDYTDFVYRSVDRYKRDIKYWEIWNEPNIGFFRGTIPQYVDMLKTAAVAAGRGDAEARVVFGGTAGVDVPFIRRCYELGAKPYFDVMAVHPYQWTATFNDGWFTEKLTNCRALMDEWGDTEKPIWLTELGWSTANEKITEAIQARLLVQCYVTALGLGHLGVRKVFWFCVKDWGGPNYGLFRPDSTKKPAFHAYRVMTGQLEGKEYLGKVAAEGARCHAFAAEGAQEATVVLWAPGTESVPVVLKATGREIRATEMLGEERTLRPDGGMLRLDATPAPIYLSISRAEAEAPAERPPQRAFRAAARPRPPVWITAIPQGETARPYLERGRATELQVRVWNAGDETAEGRVAYALEGTTLTGEFAIAVPPRQSRDATLRLTVPEGADLGPAKLKLEPDGLPAAAVEAPVRIADGPTVEFLANSHLERHVYFQPGAKSGCSESRRFGSEWTYKLRVPFGGAARLQARIGAHNAQEWSLRWSRDGKTWQTALEGKSWTALHSAQLPTLKAGDLYLRCQGNDQQLDELVVEFVRPK